MNAMAMMLIGIAIASMRHVDDQARQPTERLSASPAPMSDTMTQISVRCRATSGCSSGSGSGRSGTSAKMIMPAARKTMGIESGRRPSTRGRSAAASVATPTARISSDPPSNSMRSL
jgi:hypothetical protein